MFAALEGKLSSLVSEWKTLWRAHCRCKNIPIKRDKIGLGGGGRGGDGGWDRMRSRMLKSHGAGSGISLPGMVRELFISTAEAGVDIEVCVAAVHKSGCWRVYRRQGTSRGGSIGCLSTINLLSRGRSPRSYEVL